MDDDSIDTVILRIDMGYLVTLLRPRLLARLRWLSTAHTEP
jgi:hypothetical protein